VVERVGWYREVLASKPVYSIGMMF